MPARKSVKSKPKEKPRSQVKEDILAVHLESTDEETPTQEVKSDVQDTPNDEMMGEHESMSEISEPQESSEAPAELRAVQESQEVSQEDPSPFTNDWQTESVGHKKRRVFLLIVLLLLIAVLTGLVLYLFKSNVVSFSAKPTPTEVPSPSPEPTEAAVDLSKYSIEILNGSGVAGAAADAQEFLEGEGFTVDSVGNAENSDFTDTEISAKESVDESYIDALKKALGKEYSVADATVELESDSDTDVIVTLGTKSE